LTSAAKVNSGTALTTKRLGLTSAFVPPLQASRTLSGPIGPADLSAHGLLWWAKPVRFCFHRDAVFDYHDPVVGFIGL
jgi:hypothetical protein